MLTYCHWLSWLLLLLDLHTTGCPMHFVWKSSFWTLTMRMLVWVEFLEKSKQKIHQEYSSGKILQKIPNDVAHRSTFNIFFYLFIARGYCGAWICVKGISNTLNLISQPREIFSVPTLFVESRRSFPMKFLLFALGRCLSIFIATSILFVCLEASNANLCQLFSLNVKFVYFSFSVWRNLIRIFRSSKLQTHRARCRWKSYQWSW